MSTHQSEATYLVRLRCQSAANGVPYLETLEAALKQILSTTTSGPICTEPDNLFLLSLDVVASDWFECEICGDNHSDSLHGEPLVSLDHGRSSVEQFTLDQIILLDNLLEDDDVLVRELMDEAQANVSPPVDDPLDFDYQQFDFQMDEVAEKYGYIIHNSSEMGVWAIYKAVTSLF